MSDTRKFSRTASLTLCGVVSPSLDGPCPARVLNQSPDGLLLELDCELPVDDSLVKFYIADEIRGTINYDSPMFLVGFVRWCRRETDSWSGMFQAGIQLISKAPRKDWR